jgi:hypothetical protein
MPEPRAPVSIQGHIFALLGQALYAAVRREIRGLKDGKVTFYQMGIKKSVRQNISCFTDRDTGVTQEKEVVQAMDSEDGSVIRRDRNFKKKTLLRMFRQVFGCSGNVHARHVKSHMRDLNDE